MASFRMGNDEPFMVPGWDLAVQDGSADHICALDRNLTITWTNRAWKRFATLNGGDPSMASEGSHYTDPITPPLDEWYREHLLTCLNSGKAWQHEYDCAAPLLYRRAMLMAYPGVGRALMLVHTWLVERPLDPESARPRDFEPEEYRDDAGILHQCMHCRRVRRLNPAGRWDWVGEWVAAAPPMTSHGLCEPCLDHYYPAAS